MNDHDMDENLIDVTNTSDVTNQINETETMDLDDDPTNLISYDDKYGDVVDPKDLKFHSIDGNIYLGSYEAIDWNSTIENIPVMEQNLVSVRQLLRELIFARARGELTNDTPIVGTVYDVVKPFLDGFGLRPIYYDTYPGITYADVAFCYCIDAIETINVVLNEAIRYRDIKEMLAVFQSTEQTNEEEET